MAEKFAELGAKVVLLDLSPNVHASPLNPFPVVPHLWHLPLPNLTPTPLPPTKPRFTAAAAINRKLKKNTAIAYDCDVTHASRIYEIVREVTNMVGLWI